MLSYKKNHSFEKSTEPRNFKARGLIAHSCFITTPEEEVLGLTYQKVWGRNPENYGERKLRDKRKVEKKESYNWLESFDQTQNYLEKHPHVIFVGDRGADMLTLFNVSRRKNIDFLIRACFNRRIENNEKKLFEHLEEAKLLGYKKIEVTEPKTKKKRLVNLEIKFSSVTLSAKKFSKKSNIKSVNINGILANEVGDTPKDKKICWRLLTTLPIKNLEDAIKCIAYYKTRWLIERFHFTLKSGCKIEKLQLRDSIKIDRALSLYSITAWRLMALTYLARVKPDLPCTLILEEDEWKALYCYTSKTRKITKKILTIKEAITQIAKIGGFLGRKSDGSPGMKVVWLGLSALNHIVESYRLWCKKA